MGYARWQPRGRLARFVESFAIQESPAGREPAVPTRVLPTGRADLAIAFGDPFVEVRSDGEVPAPALALGGLRTRAASYRATGATGLFLVRFHPWATGAFGPCAEITDRLVDLEAVLGGPAARLLVERLREAGGSRERARLVEGFLLRRLPSDDPDPIVVAAVRRLRARRGRGTIAQLAASVGAGRRHLGRLFRRNVGAGPKALARILRFQAAMSRKRGGAPWSEVAAGHGFTDHAHLTRECARLAGVTPRAFETLAARGPLQSFYNAGGAGRGDDVLYL